VRSPTITFECKLMMMMIPCAVHVVIARI
jgi:hypothetical protein